MSDFYYNDGGRVESGRRGIAGDCAVRAMAIALELDYDACYKEIAQANKDNGRAKSLKICLMVLLLLDKQGTSLLLLMVLFTTYGTALTKWSMDIGLKNKTNRPS